MIEMLDTVGLFVLDVLNHPERACVSFAAAVCCVLLCMAVVADHDTE